METILVSISTLVNIVSVPYLIWRIGTIDNGTDGSILRFTIEVIIFAIAIAITARYYYCINEREKR